MLKTYKYPQIPDQDKEGTGNVLLGVQDGESITPLTFSTGGNNSAIVSFTAVKFNQFKKEVDRITLATSLIAIDLTNNIYKVDGLTDYATALENGMYRFEFQNNFNLWKTEYFKVIDKDLEVPTILITITPTALFTAGINLTFASGTLTEDWKDASPTENFVSGIELTNQYVDAGTNIAETTGDLVNITKFIADNSRITFISNLITGLLTDFKIHQNLYTGVLDMSLAPVSGIFHAYNNAALTGITFASSGNSLMTSLLISSCNLSTLDLSNVPISGAFTTAINSNLTSITFSLTGNALMTSFVVRSCNLSTLDLTNVPVSGSFHVYSNSNLTGITFASAGNSLVNSFRAYLCNLTGTLDLSNVPIGVEFHAYNNSALTGVTFSATSNTLVSSLLISSCNLSTLDLSNVPVSGVFTTELNNNLTSITFSLTGNALMTSFVISSCNLSTLDLSNVPIGTKFHADANSSLTSITFASAGNVLTNDFQVFSCNLSVLDLTNVPVSGLFWANANTNMTSITFSTTGNSLVTSFRGYTCNLSTLDLTNVPIGGVFFVYSNTNLNSITLSAAGNSALSTFHAYSCNLPNLDFSVFPTSDGVNIRLDSNSMTATEHDNQLINLDNTAWINGMLQIITGNTARTAASDTAYNNLISNGWTIT